MIRLLLRLFNIRDFEVCQSCETLKQQLDYERSEKRQLTETLLNIIRPSTVEAAPVILNPITQTGGLFSRRRAALEAKDREDAKILKQSTNLGKPDIITDKITTQRVETEKLEQELGIVSNEEEKIN